MQNVYTCSKRVNNFDLQDPNMLFYSEIFQDYSVSAGTALLCHGYNLQTVCDYHISGVANDRSVLES